MQQPLVSIIIPTYNRATRIIKTLDSIFYQTYQNFEVIAVDDGSTDNTIQILTDYKQSVTRSDIVFKILTQKNAGAPTARNNGLKNANGEYIVFFDSDDLMLPERIETQIKIMVAENSDCCACGFLMNSQLQKYQPSVIEKKEILWSFFKNKLLGSTQSWMLKKSLVLQVDGYDESLKCRQDFDIIFRILTLHPKISITKQILSVFIDHDDEDRIMSNVQKSKLGYHSVITYYSKVINYCIVNKKITLLSAVMRRYSVDVLYTFSSIKYTDMLRESKCLIRIDSKGCAVYQNYIYILAFIYMNYSFARKQFRVLLNKHSTIKYL